jgi:hypothetical protein
MKLEWTPLSRNKGEFECNDTLAHTLLAKKFATEVLHESEIKIIKPKTTKK